MRAWREGLDRDHDDRMDYGEFTLAVRDVGYAGNPRELWEELDVNKKLGLFVSSTTFSFSLFLLSSIFRIFKCFPGFPQSSISVQSGMVLLRFFQGTAS